MPDTLDRDAAADAALETVRRTFPVAFSPFDPAAQRTGLIIVDEVNGFAAVGCGPLAPAAPNMQVSRMIVETDRLARRFTAAGWPIVASLDSHDEMKPEPPYPAHCIAGSGHDELVPELKWLEADPNTTLIAKDCINFVVGAMQPDGSNRLLDWINGNRLKAVLTVGICTDICVMDFVLTLLSMRNHGMTPTLKDVVVHEPGCSTYDLPLEVARSLGLPDTAAHPQAPAHHMGLYFMAARGALLSDAVS